MPGLQRARRGHRPRQPPLPGPSATATTTSSPARRSGPASATPPTTARCSCAPTPTCPSTAASRWLIVPMDLPGIDVRPLRTMEGSTEFCEVFFDEVRVPVANRVGAENDGWRVDDGDAQLRARHRIRQRDAAVDGAGARSRRRWPRRSRATARPRGTTPACAATSAASVPSSTRCGRSRSATSARPSAPGSSVPAATCSSSPTPSCASVSATSRCTCSTARRCRSTTSATLPTAPPRARGRIHALSLTHRRRHLAGAAQHRRRAHARPAQGPLKAHDGLRAHRRRGRAAGRHPRVPATVASRSTPSARSRTPAAPRPRRWRSSARSACSACRGRRRLGSGAEAVLAFEELGRAPRARPARRHPPRRAGDLARRRRRHARSSASSSRRSPSRSSSTSTRSTR